MMVSLGGSKALLAFFNFLLLVSKTSNKILIIVVKAIKSIILIKMYWFLCFYYDFMGFSLFRNEY